MYLLLVILVWLATIVWLLAKAFLQFRAYRMIPLPGKDVVPCGYRVDVIVPARNENATIDSCLKGLVCQKGAPGLTITVVDDNSSDCTAAIVQRFVEYESNVRLLEAGLLPAGWTGKCNACWKGACQTEGEWLCFMDADTVAGPELIRAAVAYAEEEKIDLLSLEPHQELKSFWERLVIPAGLLLVSFVTDLKGANAPDTDDAAAVGQFILVRRQAYEAIGGHAGVRGDIAEDIALARLAKRAGFRTRLVGGNGQLRVRLYRGLRALWEGLSKNVVDIAGGTRTAVAAVLTNLLISWLAVILPLRTWEIVGEEGAAVSAATSAGFVFALLGAAAIFCTSISTARYFRIPFWYGILFPIGAVALAVIAANGIRMHLTGLVRWKGRVYQSVPVSGEHEAITCEEKLS